MFASRRAGTTGTSSTTRSPASSRSTIRPDDLSGTFYVATQNVEIRPRDRLGPHGTQSLAERFEIGAHTRLHLRLLTPSLAAAHQEMVSGNAELEDAMGRKVPSHCHPGGSYRPDQVTLVRAACFTVARNVKRYSTVASSPLEMPTTGHTLRPLLDASAVLRTCACRLKPARRAFWNWDLIAIKLFDQVSAIGGACHIWGRAGK